MLVRIFLIVMAAYLSFEIIEHLLLPLIGRVFWKGRRLLTGPEGMIGKNGRVREWQGNGFSGPKALLDMFLSRDLYFFLMIEEEEILIPSFRNFLFINKLRVLRRAQNRKERR
jgi:hypothetical protein